MTAARLSVASWLRWIAVLALVGIVGLCAAVVGVGLLLSAPARFVVGAPPADLNAESVEFQSASGATVRGWFVAGRAGGGAVVLRHGLRANRLSMVRRAQLLKAEGYAVLLVDFQAHGESTGSRITFGHLEGRDAAAAVALVRLRLPNEKIGVIGTSLGGAAALLGSLAADAYVLEAVYPNIGAATANRISVVLGTRIGALASKLLVPLFEFLMSPILGVTPADLQPIGQIADIGAPVLLLGGMSDNRTPPEETTALFERAHAPKYIWLIQGAGHVDLEQYAPELYREHVLGFLSRALRPGS